MGRRLVIQIPGVTHGANPTAAAVRIGNMLFSSGILGIDPSTNSVVENPERQVQLVFQHMKTIVEAAGGSTDDIGQVIFSLKDGGHRQLVNQEWSRMFPDLQDQPARNVQIRDMSGAMVINVLMTAVIDD